jgi:hypothetical protein
VRLSSRSQSACQQNNVTYAKQECEATPIKQCKFNWAHSQNGDKRLLASSCLSCRVCLRLSVWVSVRPSARPSVFVHMEQLCFQWTDFHGVWYLTIFGNVSRKFNFYKNLTRITGTLHEDLSTFMIISRLFLLLMRNVSARICRENQNTYFMFSNFFPEYGRLWDNMGKYGRAIRDIDDNVIQRMRCACWITKATSTNSEYVMHIALVLQQWFQERPSLLCYNTLLVLFKFWPNCWSINYVWI